MNIKQSIYWHQGLFLQPQHFQQLEMHQRFIREPLVRMINPFAWGIERLEMAESALANRMAEVRALRLILPDQTYLEYPGNLVIAARSFDKIWTDPELPLNVYLAIRRFSVSQANVTVVDSMPQAADVRTRFASLSNPAEVSDLYSGEGQALVPTITHVARLVFESELAGLDDHDVVALARLTLEGDQVRVASQHVPPAVCLSSSAFLGNVVKDIRDDMLGRLRQLEEYKSPRGVNAEDLDANFLMMMQAVQVLNRHVPALTHLLEVRAIHPWHVYGQLRQCVGELSTFSHRFDVYGRLLDRDDGLPAYDHESLGVCFVKAREIISQLLAEIAVGPEFHVALSLQGDVYTGTIPSDYLGSRHRFYLILQSEGMKDVDVRDLLGVARLAASAVMSDLIDHALPGLDLMELPGPPQGLPRRSDARYFRIEQMSEGWEQIEQGGEIAFYWPQAPEGLRVIVVATRS
ncbi:type VI secretion system baseplate subunit TssK [Orrella daihaiensis]|uniref:Type VI secretion system baseplate subunit TssK n=1 Tax=Orrella daihaiensis TaxID=2782176 RepID=A0ABY4AIR1_9BURK|nr:type VI secretion system baseplate subunit TssK [Orrella daihaiensis]UOD50064.1 type VI secretion system baseplate subunit TssK [Orrella daihaiensis]